MDDRAGEASPKTRDNLRRLMADLGLTIDQVAEKSRLDKRTIRGILDGTAKPQMRTIGRLAKGLGVSSNEFFLEPSQLLYRRFDRDTNPLVQQVVETHPEVFADWTAVDFDELHSRVGTGGPLTAGGALSAARQMNVSRHLQEKLAILMESSQAEVIAEIIELFYRKVVNEQHPPKGA